MKSDPEILEAAEQAFDRSQMELARSLLKPLIERGVGAAVRLNACYGEPGMSDEEADRAHVAGIVQAAELGDLEARYRVGVWYDIGEFGFKEDKNKASRIFKELADEGDLHCLWIYAIDLLWGRGAFDADPEVGLAKLRQAIELGSSESCITLAMIYNDGQFSLGPDRQERDRLRMLAKELAADDEYVYDPFD